MRLDLLTQIADELEKFKDTPELSFDMRYWLSTKFNGPHSLQSCGTICCAIGLGIIKIPEFRKLLGRVVYSVPMPVGESVRFCGVSTDVADALELSVDDCYRLFQVDSYDLKQDAEHYYVKKEDVVSRIREFIKSHTKETNETL